MLRGPARGRARLELDRALLGGTALALYLASGSWSLARVAGVEPSWLWQPRVWAVGLLLALSLLPAPRSRTQPERRGATGLLAELAWLGFTLVAIAWAPALELAEAQALDLGLLIATAFALRRLAHVVDPRALAEALRLGLLVLLGALATLALVSGVGGGRMAVLGGGPNVFGRNMGILAILALERTLATSRPAQVQARAPGQTRSHSLALAWAALACVCAGLVALSGSRGAMFSTLLAAAFLLGLGPAKLSARLGWALVSAALFLGLLLFTNLGEHIAESFVSRVVELLFGERYVSSRDQIYRIALDGGALSPVLGRGLASFAAETPWPYAHNLILDAWYETGLVGVMLLGLYAARMASLIASRGLAGRELWLALAVLVGVGAQFSGGRYDARALLVCAAMAACLSPVRSPPAPAHRPLP